MQLSQTQLQAAANAGLLRPEQVQPLWQFLASQAPPEQPQFKAAHLLYYFGGVLAIAAMTLFMTLSQEHYGGIGLAVLAFAYGLLGFALAEYCRQRSQLLLCGIFATFALVQTPLLVYGLQLEWGMWLAGYQKFHQWIDGRWLYMELATLAVAALALYRYRLPFLLLPVAVTLWYLSMDLAPLLLQNSDASWQQRKWVSVGWGLLTLALALKVDVRDQSGRDFAFWLYLSGLLSFWGGLTAMHSDSELGKAIYALVNLLLIGCGLALRRRLFVPFGALGFMLYLGHLAFDLFEDSNWFPLVLCAIGFAVIYAGVLWQRHQRRWSAALSRTLPASLQQLAARRA